MGIYPPLETVDNNRLQHVAEVKSRLEKERDFRASMYVGGLDTALSVATVGLAATGVGLLSTIIAVPVARPSAFKPERSCVGCWAPAVNL